MKVLFCNSTEDINAILSRAESKDVKRNGTYVPILDFECQGFTFHLSNSARVRNEDYIHLITPKNPDYKHYHIKLSDKAYEDLINNGRCGTRYGNSSKINVIIDEEL